MHKENMIVVHYMLEELESYQGRCLESAVNTRGERTTYIHIKSILQHYLRC